ncbi:3-oxoacyl-ACP synthase [Fervidicella metallireducens AeB]|uniref:Beta-ketoacyl-[acyl-carrier-protein] synthase III n=1 Tax=Fervidicella metallireducens AeB TaxID=1403537 RepID=A0A017RY12_9CLOT|nr:beta-ketoacyl-ACP synthase III [Fervidicella metallireducens]EYE89304.1 3-oxoacyl-ACP synthase [Fervidicella metallireducens AeB]
MIYNAGITGIGISVPNKILTNHDLEEMVETSNEWIITRTGIKERRIVNSDEAASDLSTDAAKKALQMAKINAEEVDLIIVCTVTPDMMYPSTAALVQNNIGANKAAAFDLSAGCTGFIYGVTVATQFINSGFYKNILVIGCDILSKVTDFTNRNTCVLFGDGAGAVVISRTEDVGVIDAYIKADGSGGEYLYLPAGGSRMPASIDTVNQKLHYTFMNGTEVFKFAVKAMPEAVNCVLEKSNCNIDEIDYFIPHQANIRIIESATKRLGIPMDKIGITIDKYGNMSSASIPVTLFEAYADGKIKKGNKVILVGFGAGLTYGSVLLNWLL